MPANSAKSRLQENLPLVAGLLLTVLLLRLGAWQLDRASEKKALAEAFANRASIAQVTETLSPEQYQALEGKGRYLTDRQVLIDNAIVKRPEVVSSLHIRQIASLGNTRNVPSTHTAHKAPPVVSLHPFSR